MKAPIALIALSLIVFPAFAQDYAADMQRLMERANAQFDRLDRLNQESAAIWAARNRRLNTQLDALGAEMWRRYQANGGRGSSEPSTRVDLYLHDGDR